MSDWRETGTDFLAWFKDEALPFWATHALDPAGGFYEALSPTGDPLSDLPRRVRVQARQAYVFAHAHSLDWIDGRAASDHAFAQLIGPGARGGPKDEALFGGLYHALAADGTVTNDFIDTYDHAFGILASIWRLSAFKDPDSAAFLSSLKSFCVQELGHADGSFDEGHPLRLPRRQNPHMHMMEAFLSVYALAGDQDALKRASAIYNLFAARFFDGSAGVLREFFNEHWRPDFETGHLVEPGHMMEWCWLLDTTEAETGHKMEEPIALLFAAGERLGLDPESGFLWDTVSIDPAQDGPAKTRRMWVQTEYIRACLTLARRGDAAQADKAGALLARFKDTYLTPGERTPKGGYVDRYDQEGRVISETMPTSTLYHLMTLATEVDKALS